LRGRGISESSVGAVQALSNLEEQPFNRFIEAWYADSYRDGRVKIKVGRQYAATDFGVVENGVDFLNSSYGLNPTTPMPTFPAPELGGSVWVAPTSWLSTGVGVFTGGTLDAPTEGGGAINRRPFAIFEARFQPFGKNAASHGSYGVGLWRQSRGAWLSAADGNTVPVRNHGVYVIADHWFMRSLSGEHRGPGVFFQWGWTPSDRNEITGYTGAEWRGQV
jgi:carbohydrate-selective porin OprB